MRRVCGIALGAVILLRLIVAAAAQSDPPAVAPPFDVSALRARFGSEPSPKFVCPDPPAAVESVSTESKYAPGSDSSEIDPERLAAYQDLSGRLKDFTSPLTRIANDFVRARPPSPTIAACGAAWLSTWAAAKAMEQPDDRKGEAVRAWNLAPIALAYIQLRDSISYQDRSVIEPWIRRLGERVMADFSAGDDLPSRHNNHRYWAGWAVMTAAAAVDDASMFDWAIESARIGIRAVTADGFLPLELERGGRALGYHLFAVEALVMIAEAARANGIDLFAENNGALLRLANTTLAGLSDSRSFERATGTRQEADIDITGTKLAWTAIVVPRREVGSAAYFSDKLENTVSLAAGGDVRLLYPGPEAKTSAGRQTLEQSVQAALAMDAPGRQHLALLDALAAYDDLSVQAPDEVKGFDFADLALRTAQSIAAYADGLAPDDPGVEPALASLRDVMPRVRDPVPQLELYAKLAEIESRKDADAAVATIMKISARTAALPPGEDRDRLRSITVRLALSIPAIPVETVVRWAISISHPRLRIVALRAGALARIAAGEVNKEVFAAAAMDEAAGRTATLVYLATRYASERRFQSALMTTLAISDSDVVARDAAVTDIYEKQLAVNFRPDAVYAPFALSDPAARDAMLAELSQYAVRRSRLSLARDIAATLEEPANGYRAWLAIAVHAREQRFKQIFDDAFGKARAAAEGIEEPSARKEAIGALAIEAIEAGNETAAMALATKVGDAALTETVVARAALGLVATGDIEGAQERLAAITDTTQRSKVSAALYRYYLGKARPEEAAALEPWITTAAGRVVMLVAQAEFAFGDPAGVSFDPAMAGARLSEAEDLLGEVEDPEEHQELAVALAAAYGIIGDVDAIGRLADAAPTDLEHGVLRPIWLGTMARAGDAKTALDSANRTFDDGLRSHQFAEIARAEFALGDPQAALDIASRIDSDNLRVRLFRSLAESHMAASRAAATDDLESFVSDASPEIDPTLAPRVLGRHVIQAVSGSTLARRQPDLPDIDAVTGASVRAALPVVQPGQAMVVPTGFSSFNEKFSYIRYLNSLDFVGGDDNVFAQGQRTLFPSFIVVVSGVFDLPTLKSQIEQGTGIGDFLTSDGRVYQLNVPLLIGNDATLVVSSADVEELRLNTAANAYIVNSGRFFLVGSTLTSWDPGPGAPTPRSKEDWIDFNAFYVAWSGSETYVADAHVNGLGYGNGKSYGFVLSSGPENVLRATSNAVARPEGIIVDSLFTDMYYGFYSYEATDVSVVGNTYEDSAIYAIDPHDWSENLTFAYNTALGTHVKHGIVTSREVRHSYIVGNITAGNAGSGILLDRTSNDNVIAYNLSIDNRGDGMTLYESSCNLVYRNTFAGNDRAGVRIRNSADILFFDNIVSGNADAGLSAYTTALENDPRHATRDFVVDPYDAYTDFAAIRNAITENGGGAVEADAVSAMVLAGNRLSGDADAILKNFALGDAGPQALSLASTGVAVRDICRPARPVSGCAFRDQGYIGADPVGAVEAAGQLVPAQCGPDLADATASPAMSYAARSR